MPIMMNLLQEKIKPYCIRYNFLMVRWTNYWKLPFWKARIFYPWRYNKNEYPGFSVTNITSYSCLYTLPKIYLFFSSRMILFMQFIYGLPNNISVNVEKRKWIIMIRKIYMWHWRVKTVFISSTDIIVYFIWQNQAGIKILTTGMFHILMGFIHEVWLWLHIQRFDKCQHLLCMKLLMSGMAVSLGCFFPQTFFFKNRLH